MTIKPYRKIDEKITFKGPSDMEGQLGSEKQFKLKEGQPVVGNIPLLAKTVDQSLISPTKMRAFSNCLEGFFCQECFSETTNKREFSSIINQIKRMISNHKKVFTPILHHFHLIKTQV